MYFIIDKPYSFSTSICALLVSIIMILKTDLLLAGLMFLIGSLLIFVSLEKTRLKLFLAGQLFIYTGVCIFFYNLFMGWLSPINILIVIAFTMFHVTFKFIKKTEYE